MQKSKLFALLGILVVLGGLLYAGPSILQVYMGGTGATSFTAHGVLIGEGSSALAPTGAGTSGQVLTSNGASADPTFQAAAGGGGSQNMFPLEGCTPDTSGNIFWTVAVMTNYRFQHWEWADGAAFGGTDVILYCTVKLPHGSIPSGTPKIVFDLSANDGTPSHTMTFKTCDTIYANTGSINVGALTCQSTQNFSTTSTAWALDTLTFGVNAALAADSILVVAIHATAQSSLAANVTMSVPHLEIQ